MSRGYSTLAYTGKNLIGRDCTIYELYGNGERLFRLTCPLKDGQEDEAGRRAFEKKVDEIIDKLGGAEN